MDEAEGRIEQQQKSDDAGLDIISEAELEENRGLEYMFVMMNAARFSVGAPAAYPSVISKAKPSSSRSVRRGGPSETGAASAAWASG